MFDRRHDSGIFRKNLFFFDKKSHNRKNIFYLQHCMKFSDGLIPNHERNCQKLSQPKKISDGEC
jgi:hypothetical protein